MKMKYLVMALGLGVMGICYAATDVSVTGAIGLAGTNAMNVTSAGFSNSTQASTALSALDSLNGAGASGQAVLNMNVPAGGNITIRLPGGKSYASTNSTGYGVSVGQLLGSMQGPAFAQPHRLNPRQGENKGMAS